MKSKLLIINLKQIKLNIIYKISALLSKELGKYEYLAGKDLKYKLLKKSNWNILHWVKFLIKD